MHKRLHYIKILVSTLSSIQYIQFEMKLHLIIDVSAPQIFSLTQRRLLKVKVAQSCPNLCDPMDYTVHGIIQTRILEVTFSRGSSQPID